MKRKTVLTDDHIYILHQFLVDEVEVFQKLSNGQEFKPKGGRKQAKEEQEEDNSPAIEKDSFLDRYLHAVEFYKKHFKNWQSGAKVEAFDVRKIFLPLYEREPNHYEIMQMLSMPTKEEYIYHHSVSVAVLSYLLGKAENMKSGDIIQLGLAGLLSDCGMAKLPQQIFMKSGSLTSEEYDEIKKHPIYGYRMIENIPGFSKNALLGVLQHHEREDGSGYPLKVTRDKLHQFAKIIAIADTFHAMTTERPFRSAKSPYQVLDEMLMDGFGKLDQQYIHRFMPIVTSLAIGEKVRLNNNEPGEIIYLHPDRPTRPLITIADGKQIDLSKEKDLYIEYVQPE
ncbi:HD-GYP domain-containing protein [Salisediminibacterium beveridgei]|uniref:HD-GYP domain-containing protein n=1 Tax=Salisediminibacterium beveridgei TaxID=632773 RepID=A0A1D7R083_9BACI|nr:HD-GYP domain-containing protein [Salisediminibacterium beveridgei]AOM84668.1 hypothetical protein BBEV_3377 [Salisediminibacterium beveridgei]